MSIITLLDYLNWAETTFLENDLHFGHGTDNAWDEALGIASFVLKLSPDVSMEEGNRVLSQDEWQQLKFLSEKRVYDRIPVPYLTHEAWFLGKKYYIDERVIIPRSPLAELIHQAFQPWIGKTPIRRILDLCAGSASIAIACAYAFPEAEVDAVDISIDALAVARKNLELHEPIRNRVHLIQSDLFEACQGQYDIIISNPPYVSVDELDSLPKEYHWEPKLALAAGEDGLQIVRRILQSAPPFLSNQGLLIVEVGNSEEALIERYPKTPFIWVELEYGGQGVFLLTAEDKECWKVF